MPKSQIIRRLDRTWTCSHCGAELDRDINAAINIKNEGCMSLDDDIQLLI
ncbi:zinc ribbon domain-containing protein [Desulfosporosinus sp. FKA]|nr:zinc ribbon domain-containing protein [Desulfosporosinus sp. FKA]